MPVTFSMSEANNPTAVPTTEGSEVASYMIVAQVFVDSGNTFLPEDVSERETWARSGNAAARHKRAASTTAPYLFIRKLFHIVNVL